MAFILQNLRSAEFSHSLSTCGNSRWKSWRSRRVIPWPAIVGLRNLLAHGYEIISPEKLWQTVTVSVPELLKHLDAAIEKQPPFEV